MITYTPIMLLLVVVLLAGCTPYHAWQARDYLLVDDRAQGVWLTDDADPGSVVVEGNGLAITTPGGPTIHYEILQLCCEDSQYEGYIRGGFLMRSQFGTWAKFTYLIEDDIMLFRWSDDSLRVYINGRLRLRQTNYAMEVT